MYIILCTHMYPHMYMYTHMFMYVYMIMCTCLATMNFVDPWGGGLAVPIIPPVPHFPAFLSPRNRPDFGQFLPESASEQSCCCFFLGFGLGLGLAHQKMVPFGTSQVESEVPISDDFFGTLFCQNSPSRPNFGLILVKNGS